MPHVRRNEDSVDQQHGEDMGSGKTTRWWWSVAILGERLVELMPPCLSAKAVEAAGNLLNVNLMV
jgi:hypothetical protein